MNRSFPSFHLCVVSESLVGRNVVSFALLPMKASWEFSPKQKEPLRFQTVKQLHILPFISLSNSCSWSRPPPSLPVKKEGNLKKEKEEEKEGGGGGGGEEEENEDKVLF